jgi:hypothetical protein
VGKDVPANDGGNVFGKDIFPLLPTIDEGGSTFRFNSTTCALSGGRSLAGRISVDKLLLPDADNSQRTASNKIKSRGTRAFADILIKHKPIFFSSWRCTEDIPAQ